MSSSSDEQQQQHSNHDEEEISNTPSSSTEEADETSTTTITANTTSATITTTITASTTPTAAIISKNDLMELIKAVKFANPDYSQRDVYKEIVNEIPIKFPQYSSSVNDTTITLNDIKKVWKKAVLLPQQQQNQSDNNNNDLAERLRKMNTTPEVYSIGVSSGSGTGSSSSSSSTETTTSAAKDYIELYLKQLINEEKEKTRLILQDYVHVFLDVPADSSGSKPHQALINFQNNKSSSSTSNDNKKKTTGGGGKGNKKKGGNRSKKMTATTTANAVVAVESSSTPAPFDDAIIIKIQMAAPLSNDENEISIKHPMLLYDQERKYKTFIHPNSTLTSTSTSASDHNSEESANNNDNNNNNDDGYTKISNWINTNGIGGVLGSSGGTKAYFYSRLTEIESSSKGNGSGTSTSGTSASSGHQRILSIYVKELAPSKQEW